MYRRPVFCIVCAFLLIPSSLAAGWCDSGGSVHLREGVRTTWASTACVSGYHTLGQPTLRAQLRPQESGTWVVDADPAGACRCTCSSVAVWVDGRGPFRHGQTVPARPGWHTLYAEGSADGRVVAVLDQDVFLCSPEPERECALRDFHLKGEEVNALLHAAPTIEWASAANSPECRTADCVRPCSGETGGVLGYRLFLDRGFEAGWSVPDGGCTNSWEMPAALWKGLEPGFHTLTLQAEVRVGESVRAVKPTRYGFLKIAAPEAALPAAVWAQGVRSPYRLSGSLLCHDGCGRGPTPVAAELSPDVAGLLRGVATNTVAENRNERIRYLDLSGFRAFIGEAGSEGELAPRLLPSELARTSQGLVYRDLLADARGRTLEGSCDWENRRRDMHGVTGCRAPWLDDPTDHPQAQIYWKEVPRDGIGVAYVQGVATNLPMESEPALYVAVVSVREVGGRRGRLRLGWNTRAPDIDAHSKIPTHRSFGVALQPRERRDILVRMQMAPPPNRPDGTRSPLIGTRRAAWVVALADHGQILVEGLRLHRVREGFFGTVDGSGDSTRKAGVYFGDSDRLPSPVRTDVPLLTAEELRLYDSGARQGTLRAGSFERSPAAGGEGLVLFSKPGAFTPGGPQAGPGLDELLTPSRPLTFTVARNHDATESQSFLALDAGSGWRLDAPGRGEWTACGNTFEWEVWTSLPRLSQGPGWTWRDYNDTPLVTNLLLTKGGTPWFDAYRSRLRVDEAMPLRVHAAAGEAVKFLLNLRPRPPLKPGVCQEELTVGSLRIPIRVETLNLDLAPERNNWLQLTTTNRYDNDRDPKNGCDFDTLGWGNESEMAKGKGCQRDDFSGLYGRDWAWVCNDDFDYLVRRIREHGHVGISVREHCRNLMTCRGADCTEDPLGIRAARCADGSRLAPGRLKDPFTDLVERVARQWDVVRPLPAEPTFTYEPWRRGESPRPWIGIGLYPGYSAIPHCWSEEESLNCPASASGNVRFRALPGAQVFGSLRTVQQHRLGAAFFLAHMDAIYGGGVERAASFAAILDSYHDMGAAGVITSFWTERETRFASMIERADAGTDPPKGCWNNCEVDGKDLDFEDLERQLRWAQLYSESDRSPQPDWCPGVSRADGAHFWWTWIHLMREADRQRQLSDRRNKCSPQHCGPECYCCAYENGGTDLCEGGETYLPLGRCVAGQLRPCRFDPGESRPWCPKFAVSADEPASRPGMDIQSYVVGLDLFLAAQECEPGSPCPWLRPDQEEQGMFEEIQWKWPANARFSSGFWVGGSNLDAFHPYHLYGYQADSHQMDMFSNFEAWGTGPVGFLYKAESRPDESGEECEGSCSGIVMTESWEALRAGHTDVRWWDTLVEQEPSRRCRGQREQALEFVRSRIVPFGVGRSSGERRPRIPPQFPQGPNHWVMAGYPAESLGDGDLEEMRTRLIDALRCR